MTLKEAIVPYLDKYGLVMPKLKHGPSDNGLLYTAEYYYLLWRRKELTSSDIQHLRKVINACEIENGFYKRHPHHTRQEGPDDYIGIAIMSKWLGTTHCKEIYAYGSSHGWNFNNVNPGKFTLRSWLGRQPGFVAHIKFCAGAKPSLFQRMAQYIGLKSTSNDPPGETTNRILGELMVAAMDDHWISRKIKRFWGESLGRHYGNKGIKGALEIYFGKDHPIAKYWVNQF